MVSSRYALLIIIILAIALIPTVFHTYLAVQDDDGRSVEKIPYVFGEFSSEPYNRHKARWVKQVFDSQNWVDRLYKNSSDATVRLFVARSYDLKRLYHHPELALSRGVDLKSEGVFMLQGKPKIPVHLLKNSSGRGLVAYVLLHNGEFIKDPLAHQLLEIFKQLVSAKKSMTIFYVSDAISPNGADFNNTYAAFILMEAIKNFQTNAQLKRAE
jgi:hypothetical protein